MRRVQGPKKLFMYGKPKPATHKYYKCPVPACPFVAVIEKKLPPEKPKRSIFPQTRKKQSSSWEVWSKWKYRR